MKDGGATHVLLIERVSVRPAPPIIWEAAASTTNKVGGVGAPSTPN